MLWLLAACSGPDAPSPTPNPGPTPATVELQTSDGVTLVADLWEGSPGTSGVVLLHMNPAGGADRTDWPRALAGSMRDRGWTVIAVDRRGGGESGGVASEAYGPDGWRDVAASVEALRARGVQQVALIGASNGTTAALDYAVLAEGEGLIRPVAMGFMTGGTYTEAQHAVAAMGPIPSMFTYSTAERDWSVAQVPLDPGGWVFAEIDDGAHGTRMFEAHPGIAAQLEEFLGDRL